MDYLIEIQPLTKKVLTQAVKLVCRVFGDEDESPARELAASLSERGLKNYRQRVDDEVISLDYYTAMLNDRVVGLIGLYTLESDCKDTAWLGWYCVDEEERGKNIGAALLDFATEKAVQMGKTFLCLYTSTDKNEEAAQFIYEKHGFHITSVEEENDYTILYRRKEL